MGNGPGAAEVESGRADVVEFKRQPVSEQDVLAARHPGLLHRSAQPLTRLLLFDRTTAPFAVEDARRAVSFAVDRRALARLIGDTEPACQLVPVNFPGYAPACPYPDPPDLAAARRLLQRSGQAGVPVRIGSPVHWLPAADAVARTLRAIGFRRVEIVPMAHLSAGEAADSASRQIEVTGWLPDYPGPSAFYVVLACDVPHGPPQDPVCTRLDPRAAEAARLYQRDTAAGTVAWQKVYTAADATAAAVPLSTQAKSLLVSPRVGNYQTSPMIGPLLSQLWVR